MRQHRIRIAFFTAILATAACVAAAPATAQTPYDGLWSVTVVTDRKSVV